MDPQVTAAIVMDEAQPFDERMTAAIDLLEWLAKGGHEVLNVQEQVITLSAIEASVAVLHQGLDRIQGVTR